MPGCSVSNSFTHILGSHVLNSALNAGSTFPPLATSTAFTTVVSISGNASISVFCACTCGSTGRGGFCGGISSACSENLTPCLGDFEIGGGDAVFSGAEDVGASLSSSKSSSRAVVGLSGGYLCQFKLHLMIVEAADLVVSHFFRHLV